MFHRLVGRAGVRPAQVAPLAPDLARDLDYPFELPPLLLVREKVAVVRRGKAALRRKAQVLERQMARSGVDAPLQRVLALELPNLGRNEPEHDLSVLRRKPQRREVACALAVELHEEAVDFRRE